VVKESSKRKNSDLKGFIYRPKIPLPLAIASWE